MTGFSCGSCTLCCTVMRVATMEPPKPEHKTCDHCTSNGCSIYSKRPEQCATFQCMWLGSQRVPAFALAPALRPDRCGVVIDLNGAGTIIAHCHRPLSWKRDPIHAWLLNMAARTVVMLETPEGPFLLSADDTTERLVKVGVDASTNNRLYVRESELNRFVASEQAA